MAEERIKALSGFSFIINGQDWGCKKISPKLIVINGAMLSRAKKEDGTYPAIVNCPKIKLVGEAVVSAIGDKVGPKVLVSVDEGFITAEDYTAKDGTVKGEFVIGVTKAHVVEKSQTSQSQQSAPVQQAAPQEAQPAPAPQPAAPAQQDVSSLLAAMGIS